MSAGDLGGPRFAAVAAAAKSPRQTRQPRLSATRVRTRGPPCDATRARPPRAVPSSAATRAVRDKRGSRDVLSNLERSVFGQRKTRRTTYGDLVRKVPRNGAASPRAQKLGTDDTIDVGRWRKSAGSRFRAMAEPWSVRRARDAGEAFRPARKAASEDHDDDASPASRDGRSAERSRRAASAAPAPRLGPIVALVTRRDRVQHVYCKRTNETVPCVAIRLADDTFDGLRVVLWRAHAAADVGAERRERRR